MPRQGKQPQTPMHLKHMLGSASSALYLIRIIMGFLRRVAPS